MMHIIVLNVSIRNIIDNERFEKVVVNEKAEAKNHNDIYPRDLTDEEVKIFNAGYDAGKNAEKCNGNKIKLSCFGTYEEACEESTCDVDIDGCPYLAKCKEYTELKAMYVEDKVEQKAKGNFAWNDKKSESKCCYNCNHRDKRLLVEPCLSCENYSCFEIKEYSNYDKMDSGDVFDKRYCKTCAHEALSKECTRVCIDCVDHSNWKEK
jgi:hypothetical protein